jgi:hypothetical protein
MEYKEVKMFKKDEDGLYKGRIEQIEIGTYWFKRANYDVLDISNRHDPAWVFSLFTGYRQIGQYKISIPHSFEEGQDVIVEKKDGKIVSVTSGV